MAKDRREQVAELPDPRTELRQQYDRGGAGEQVGTSSEPRLEHVLDQAVVMWVLGWVFVRFRQDGGGNGVGQVEQPVARVVNQFVAPSPAASVDHFDAHVPLSAATCAFGRCGPRSTRRRRPPMGMGALRGTICVSACRGAWRPWRLRRR